MKNYVVKVVKKFNDYEGKEIKEGVEFIERKTNDTFNCTKERYEFLKQNGVVELVEIEKIEQPKSTRKSKK